MKFGTSSRRIGRLYSGSAEHLLHRLVPDRGDLCRQALRTGQAAEFFQRPRRSRTPSRSARRDRRGCARVEGREDADLARLELDELLDLADADVERAVEHVDHQVAAALMGDDRGVDPGGAP